MQFAKKLLIIALQAAWCSSYSLFAVAAESPLPAEATTAPQKVLISAARYQQFAENIPASFEVVDHTQIADQQLFDIRDLARQFPNIDVKRAPARFTITGAGNPTGRDGNAGFSIRGFDGNRVLMLVDGIRLPRSYVNGSNAFGRDQVALDMLQQVEIIRGPASVLYGSDGLAGLVNYISLRPDDLLKTTDGARVAGRFSLHYSGDDHAKALQNSLAGRFNSDWRYLLHTSVTESGALQNLGSNDAANQDRSIPNPEQHIQKVVYLKLEHRYAPNFKQSVVLDYLDKQSSFDLLSSRSKAVPLLASSVTGEQADKHTQRSRFSYQFEISEPYAFADKQQIHLSYQQADAQDDGVTHRYALADRVRKVSYAERSWQFRWQAEKLWRYQKDLAQKFSYGLDSNRIDVTSFFGGVDPGNVDFIPRKYFPDTRDSSHALFAQSEFFIKNWIITPGLRFERYDLAVSTQQNYAPPAKNPGRSLSGQTVVPKLAALWKLASDWNGYASYAEGYRIPAAQQINGVFENSSVNAVLLANPDLRPESSRNLELGARWMSDFAQVEFSLFQARFKDLIIDKKPLGGRGTTNDPALFQTVNIDRAKVQGAEIKARLNWGEYLAGKWSSQFAYGFSRGWDLNTNLPLNSIQPAKAHASLLYQAKRWHLGLTALWQNAKSVSDLDSPYLAKPATPPRIEQFTIPAVLSLDLAGQIQLTERAKVALSIKNLNNKKYWNWSEVQGLAANSPIIDAYTQPGRHFNLSLSLSY